jgi:hypothetical protein
VHAVLRRHGMHRLAWLDDRPVGCSAATYETAAACADFIRSAAAWFARHGIDRIERVMTGNAKA